MAACEDPEMLAAAEASARRYRDHDLAHAVTTGGPTDAMHAPDSEAIAALVESFIELWESTGEPGWLNAAARAARQLASWVMAHDHPFPADSVFGRLGMRSSGTIFANAQNRGATPGICTHSGLGLLKLVDGRSLPSGWMNERVNVNDWDDNEGGVFIGPCWSAVS
jgi:hypothetical protein